MSLTRALLILSLFVIASLAVGLISGCTSQRKQVNVAIWLNNAPLPETACEFSDVRKFGFYRKLNGPQYEFVSFCQQTAQDFISLHKTDFTALIQAAGIKDAAEQ